MGHVSCVYLRNPCLMQGYKDFSLIFLLAGFIMIGFTFGIMIYFELISACGVRYRFKLFF